METIIYRDLSYEIVGIFFEVFNKLGSGLREKVYEKAIAEEFHRKGIKFQQQLRGSVSYKGQKIANYYYDFVVENSIVLEIKSKKFFANNDFQQIKNYLKIKKLKLGILASFSTDSVKFARVLNLY
jgi:GxxExxY protein